MLRRRRFGRRTLRPDIRYLLAAAAVFLAIFLLRPASNEEKAERLVKRFYQYEQSGDYGSAWELFALPM
ncbi:hypothetical protein [Paenibacillus sp. EPM92]|uniref:hypothetical protein n=1 Tax=Paenibacillus sp. EPM92 TaxID=1561195 RepID=UPI0019151FF3|nr:hypothetical protein [Paenibacillus sp. EPM92]